MRDKSNYGVHYSFVLDGLTNEERKVKIEEMKRRKNECAINDVQAQFLYKSLLKCQSGFSGHTILRARLIVKSA